MLQVNCSGTHYQIGHDHGTHASLHITRSLGFYSDLFQSKCRMDWAQVTAFALLYQPFLLASFPGYVAEMEGIAAGAGPGVGYADILALNVRTEIAFGAFSDGCTALSWKQGQRSVLAQNWDWNTEQAENLICLRITKQDGLSMQMITEAGIIGKIGLNSRGVGCTLNAIKAKGVVYNRLPCHLALRTVMESSSRRDAIAALSQYGVASACHILIGDATGGTGLECSSVDVVRLEMDGEGRVMHTNHYVLPHDDSVIEAPDWLPDTRFRLRRIAELLDGKGAEGPKDGVVEEILRDEVEGDGASICRSRGESGLATLFSIVMDLGEKSEARVLMGRPAAPTEALVLRP